MRGKYVVQTWNKHVAEQAEIAEKNFQRGMLRGQSNMIYWLFQCYSGKTSVEELTKMLGIEDVVVREQFSLLAKRLAPSANEVCPNCKNVYPFDQLCKVCEGK